MINQELADYIRNEFNKGKTRQAIREILVTQGGWSETDLNEAFNVAAPLAPVNFTSNIVVPNITIPKEEKPPFLETTKIVMPAQSFVIKPRPSVVTRNIVAPKDKSSFVKTILILLLVGVLSFALWIYRAQIQNFSNLLINKSATLFPFSNTKKVGNIEPLPIVENNKTPVVKPAVAEIKDCGIGIAPDLKATTYKKDAALACLGASAFACENAQATLKDAMFPTMFQVIKGENTCSFKLGYSGDSTLVDITGKKLAGQYILCPIGIVKTMDGKTAKDNISSASTTDHLSKFASEIYFYGVIGVFLETNLNQAKIQALGCSGDLIRTNIESYRAAKSKL